MCLFVWLFLDAEPKCEHPQHTEEIDKLLGQLEDATGKLEALSENFGKEYGHDIPVSKKDEKEILKG